MNYEWVAYLIIYSVPFCYQHSIYPSLVPGSSPRRKVSQRTIKLFQLINSFVSNESFANENNFIWVVYGYQLDR